MPKEQEQFRAAVDKMLEAVAFENWLRFYFITEMTEDGAAPDAEPRLFIIVPEKGMEKIAHDYPELLPLARELNNAEITFETSQMAVCGYIVQHIDGKYVPRDTAAGVMDSMAFQTQLQLFNTWVQLHEEQLEKDVIDFGTWLTLFGEWKATPAAENLAAKLALSGTASASTAEN